MKNTIFERVDSSGNRWLWTAKDDETAEFYPIHARPKVFSTRLALHCKDFSSLIWTTCQTLEK